MIWVGMVFLLPILGGCQDNDETPVFQAEGYLIGHHPCVRDATVMTSKGEGKGYLVATIGAKSDTLMLFGVPTDLFAIPQEWHNSLSYFFPEAGRGMFKMSFSYQKSQESIGLQFPCNAFLPLYHLLRYADPEYIVLKAEKIN
ncbi:hypothetical protein [Cyclobacterium xiamenense]|nr:hypothetical protein [Cyclobacterium xiamenense]